MQESNNNSSSQEPTGPNHDTSKDVLVFGNAVKLPCLWDRERDQEEFEARFGPDDRPLECILGRLARAYEEFNALLDSALKHYLGPQGFALIGQGAVLSAEEKIEWLIELVATRSTGATYRARFEDNLAECLFVDHERRRVLRGYLRAAGDPWLYPLCKLTDGIVVCAMEFEESLMVEDCGYKQSLLTHRRQARSGYEALENPQDQGR